MNCEKREADLILDTQGRVVCCSPAATALLGQPANVMANHPVKAVFPGLPIAANTPGYNVAYAVIHGAQGQWTPHQAQTSGGNPVVLEILLTCMKMNKELFIALNLRKKPSPLQQLTQA